MNHDKTIDLIDDRMSKSRESLVQTFNNLFIEHKNEVKQTIKETVNGKIDAVKVDVSEVRNDVADLKKDIAEIKKQMNGQNDVLDKQNVILNSLDERIKPIDTSIDWFTKTKNGVGWLAGFITPIAIVGGAIIFLIDLIKK